MSGAKDHGANNYRVSCPFFVLAIALFIYYTSVPAATKARTETK